MTDKLKNYLGWVIIIVLVVLAGAAWRYSGAYARSIQPGSFRSFAASGQGRVVIVPDVAEFSFSVLTEGALDIGKLQSDNTNKINQAIDFLKQQGIEEKNIKTAGYNLSPRYQTGFCRELCPPPSIVGYSINQTVEVKILKDSFVKIGDILAGVVKQGANSVSQLNFTVDDRLAAENEARSEAIVQAKMKARNVAKAAGFSLGELLSIEEGFNDFPRFYGLESSKMGMGGDMVASVPAPVVEPGSQEIVVNVTLRYEID